jgi:hypothetical protein
MMGSVNATLNYVDALPVLKPAFYVRPRGPGDTRAGPALGPKVVSIHDARALRDLSLDVHGVELMEQRSEVEDFYDHADLRVTYYAEIEALVREHVGARRVLAFDHNLRSQALAERGEHEAQLPVRFAHNDYTNDSGPQRVRDLLPAEADDLLERRFAVINVWRPIHATVEATPLAVCDAASLPEEHLVSMDLVYLDRLGEIQSVLWDEGHRWLYFPRMRPDEVMLLKCFDSARDGRARFTAHSAFDDPNTRENAPPRESIEVRTLAFF